MMKTNLVDVGGNHFNLNSMGTGTPPVILEGGLLSEGSSWDTVMRQVSEYTSIYRYDRPGRGKSEAKPFPRTADNISADLYMLLHAARIPAPYILVGQSFGGFVIRAFAARHRENVAGLIFVEPTHEDQWDKLAVLLPPERDEDTEELIFFRRFWTKDYKDPKKNKENIDLIASGYQMKKYSALHDIPVIVLTGGANYDKMGLNQDTVERLKQRLFDLHHEIAGQSTNSAHKIVDDCGHFIQKDHPEVIVDSIIEIVKNFKASSSC